MYKQKKIAILLATFNGEKFLDEQLKSIFNQYDKNFDVYVIDDKSTDNTLKILSKWDINLTKNKVNIGSKQSFFKILNVAFNKKNYDYFFFCDQDDIWDKDKLSIFTKVFKSIKHQENIPCLIHSDSRLIDYENNVSFDSFWKYDYLDPSKNSLNRLLVQNVVSGCMSAINRKLADILLSNNKPKNYMPPHDYWLALLASALGKIIYIPHQTMSYRQHGLNQIGVKRYSPKKYFSTHFRSILIPFRRFVNLFKPSSFDINDDHINQAKEFLVIYKNILSNKHVKLLNEFISLSSRRLRIFHTFNIIKNRFYKIGFFRNINHLFF